jgi:predicted DNA-binding transcriptional regulator YafY
MNRMDRALGILLLLHAQRTIGAPELARRFEVSTRTIYRDIETLAAVGVPVYAEMGRQGGFRLAEGYFLPPVMFSEGEAISLLTGLALLSRLRATPFAAELDSAGQKLLAAVPPRLRSPLAEAQRIVGFEAPPYDSFHPEQVDPAAGEDEPPPAQVSQVITAFLRCVLERHSVAIEYRAPRREPTTHVLAPHGLFWDRERWYLVGQRVGRGETPRVWRADRVRSLKRHDRLTDSPPPFDVAQLLGRRWLDDAIGQWTAEAPVRIRMTPGQADRLRRDWYYGHARFEEDASGGVTMTFGEDDREVVFGLLRWLGPGAELLAPEEWRDAFAADVRALLAPYERARREKRRVGEAREPG